MTHWYERSPASDNLKETHTTLMRGKLAGGPFERLVMPSITGTIQL